MKESALEVYTNAKNAVDAHIASNKEVFDAHQRLVMTLIDADNNLRDAVALEKVGCENGSFKVSYAETTLEQVDIPRLKELIAAKTVPADIINVQQRPAQIVIHTLARGATAGV